jgi:hypothetical protein
MVLPMKKQNNPKAEEMAITQYPVFVIFPLSVYRSLPGPNSFIMISLHESRLAGSFYHNSISITRKELFHAKKENQTRECRGAVHADDLISDAADG